MKQAILKWLGVKAELDALRQQTAMLQEQLSNLTSMSIDVDLHSMTTIIVSSKVDGGRVAIIPVKVRSMRHVEDIVNQIRDTYGICEEAAWDAPRGFFDVLENRMRLRRRV